MAKVNKAMNTQQMSVVFLLIIAVITLAGLYFEAAKTNRELSQQVAQLKASQVLLMVPDEQAADIAAWLGKHPEPTKALVQKAANGEAVTLSLGPGSTAENNQHFQPQEQQNIQTLENAQGVKVIPLPHGGIRITTRESDSL
ncbi:hypothetical protein BCU94_01150 [Shewanella sp. 10N.286.52.C2]|nr:hypothetical protein BCU94_01150 [Shewanella sp. 10N.286.52.C2]